MTTMTWVGLDVHARSVEAAALDSLSGELRRARFDGRVEPVVEWLAGLPAPVRACYEAGPTGYGLCRAARAAGVEMAVIAPSKTPRAAGDRIKSDRKDAELLVRLLSAGALAPVAVPPPALEAARDLARAREQLRVDLMAARHRVSKLLLRHGRVWERSSGTWTQAHRRWLARQRFEQPATELAFTDALAAIDGLLARKAVLEEHLARVAHQADLWPVVARLRCLRGIDTFSALVLHLEVGEWNRFARAPQLAAWLGLAPALRQSGESAVSGPITKTGSRRARRILVEAAKHCDRPPRIGVTLANRQQGQPDHVLQTAWRAQQRLFCVHQRLRHRGKPANVVTVAMARELACFAWALARA
ncbi:MAG TPA: IS110 family transposase [Thermoleophilia bacterium]|nr:IS110 family transposase [Thermoleophilia bacterium]